MKENGIEIWTCKHCGAPLYEYRCDHCGVMMDFDDYPMHSYFNHFAYKESYPIGKVVYKVTETNLFERIKAWVIGITR